MSEPHPVLAQFDADARSAEAAEAEFRLTMKSRVDALARERAFAFRRANLMRSLFETVGQAETREIAVVGGLAALRNRLGWVDAAPARDEVLAAYAPVAEAAYRATRAADPAEVTRDEGSVAGDYTLPVEPVSFRADSLTEISEQWEREEPAGEDVAVALVRFERWYEEARGKPFWVLFEHYMPETQLVDF